MVNPEQLIDMAINLKKLLETVDDQRDNLTFLAETGEGKDIAGMEKQLTEAEAKAGLIFQAIQKRLPNNSKETQQRIKEILS